MTKLQIAVDLLSEEEAVLLADDIHDVVDIFEIGTPMIIRDGPASCQAHQGKISGHDDSCRHKNC